MATIKSHTVYNCALFGVVFARNETSSSTEEGKYSSLGLTTYYVLYASLAFCLIILFCCLYDSCCPRTKKSTKKTDEDINWPYENRNPEVNCHGHVNYFVTSTSSNCFQMDNVVPPPTYIEVTTNMEKYMISRPPQCTSSLR